LLNWISSAATGDLTLIDFDTGATTVLAENVSQVVLQPPAETTGLSGDPLAPGLDVAFRGARSARLSVRRSLGRHAPVTARLC